METNESRKVAVSDFREEMADIVGCVQHTGSRTILTRNGKDVAAVVSVRDLHLLAEIERLLDLNEAQKALDAVTNQEMTSLQELKSKIDM